MNSWKLNSISNCLVRNAISVFFNIQITDVYKMVKSINNNHIITMSNGEKYELTLKKVT